MNLNEWNEWRSIGEDEEGRKERQNEKMKGKQIDEARERKKKNYNRISLNWVYEFYTKQIVNTLKMKFLHKINRKTCPNFNWEIVFRFPYSVCVTISACMPCCWYMHSTCMCAIINESPHNADHLYLIWHRLHFPQLYFSSGWPIRNIAILISIGGCDHFICNLGYECSSTVNLLLFHC